MNSLYITIAKCVYSQVSISKNFDLIISMLNEVYFGIVEAEIKAGKDAITDACIANKSELLLNNAICHLQSAYNIMNELLNKKVVKKGLLFSSEVELCDNKNKIYEINSYITITIYYLYDILSEKNIAEKWKKIAQEQFYKQLVLPRHDEKDAEYAAHCMRGESGYKPDYLYSEGTEYYSEASGNTYGECTYYMTAAGWNFYHTFVKKSEERAKIDFENFVKKHTIIVEIC